jgi:hypothetical protein
MVFGPKHTAQWWQHIATQQVQLFDSVFYINLLAPEFGIYILAHPVCKTWIVQEPNKVVLWNKRQFEGGKKNGECAACLKNSVRTFVEKNIQNGVFGG